MGAADFFVIIKSIVWTAHPYIHSNDGVKTGVWTYTAVFLIYQRKNEENASKIQKIKSKEIPMNQFLQKNGGFTDFHC